MFISKKNRIEVYSYLFKEGVLVAKKDNFKPKHDEIDVPNLEVLNLMKSLKSRGFVRETFNWQYFYWYLENEGVEYLREYLHLPAEIVPATLKKATARPVTAGGRAPPPGAERLEGEGPGFGSNLRLRIRGATKVVVHGRQRAIRRRPKQHRTISRQTLAEGTRSRSATLQQ